MSMLETVKYLCEFFFGQGCGWHFIGLCVLLLCIGNKGVNITNILTKKKEE